MKLPFIPFFLIAVLSVQCASPASAQIRISDGLSLYGDVRAGYFGREREERNGEDTRFHELRMRVRAGLSYDLNQKLSIRIRYATRLTSESYDFKPGLGTTAVGNRGLQTGEGGFDEAYAAYRTASLTLRGGRFVAAFNLPGLITNSILKNDAPNIDVKYTEGLWLTYRLSSGWVLDAITQLHLYNYPTNEMRAPLDFSEPASRVSYFLSAIKNRSGTVRMAGVSAILLPQALPSGGGTKTYLAVSAKTATGWNLPDNRELIWGAETAWSMVRLTNSALNLSGNPADKAGGLGAQTNLTLRHVLPKQHLGLVAASLQPMLLTSADYWNDGWMWEIRHQWFPNRQLSFESRLRFRGDNTRRINAVQKRAEMVPYVRLTYRFR